ncbi:MAG: lysophospholipid acyltransferase family protein [Abitibacteriaceae bacterium]|nr:lysophospholipid acyltransferase family protein [Abditibacteriaceae bacterium]
MELTRNAAELRLIQVLGAALERGSWSLCRHTGAWMGLVFYKAARRRREIAIDNLRLAFPHLSVSAASQIARRSAQNFGMSFCEFLHLRTASAEEIKAYSDWSGVEYIQQALQRGHGALVTTAHFGSWEVMGTRIAQEFPLTVVVRLTSNMALQEHIKRVRKTVNIKMILKQESARASLNVLRNNEVLGIFPDQYATANAALLPMFGHPTRFVTSPARLALSSQAPIIPTFGVRRKPWLADGRVLINVLPGLYLQRQPQQSREETVLEGTQFIIKETENIVRQHPDQWLWLHRRWRSQDLTAQNGTDSIA